MAVDDSLAMPSISNIVMPDDAEVLLMPYKFIEIFRSLAHGAFLPFNLPLAIVCRQDVPESEIWVAKAEEINVTGGGSFSRWKVLKVFTLRNGKYEPVLESVKPIGAKVLTMPAILPKDKKEDKVEDKNIDTSSAS